MSITNKILKESNEGGQVLQRLQSMSRESIINWLQQNDPNGCFTDDRAVAEGYEPMTHEEAVSTAYRIITDDGYENDFLRLRF